MHELGIVFSIMDTLEDVYRVSAGVQRDLR